MHSRMVPGPGDGADNVTAEEAAEFLGVSKATFLRLVPRYPWVRPVHLLRSVRYRWMDVVALGHVIHQEEPPRAEKNRKHQEGAGTRRSDQESAGDTPERRAGK